MCIRDSGSIIPIALPGSIIVARIAAEAKAAPDPKPPLLIPAKTVAKVAININSKLKYMLYDLYELFMVSYAINPKLGYWLFFSCFDYDDRLAELIIRD